MIDCYFVNTPNGRKVSIMLAETALPHRLIRGDAARSTISARLPKHQPERSAARDR
jgi:hypothetical protein